MKNLVVAAVCAALLVSCGALGLAASAAHPASPAAPTKPAPAAPPPPAMAKAAPAEQLTVTQQPSALVKTIEAYFKAHKIAVREQPGPQKSIVLDLPFNAGATPAFTIVISAESLLPNPLTRQFTENGIYLSLWTNLHVEAKRRAEALDVINKWNPTRLLGNASLSETGEVRLSYGMKLLSGGLPSAYVLDAMWDLVYNWQGLYPQLKPMLQAPPAGKHAK